MNRFLYFAAFAYIALCGAIVARKVLSSTGPRMRAMNIEGVMRPFLPNKSRRLGGRRDWPIREPLATQRELASGG